jgi:putative ABC transport system permease protein
MPAQRRDQSTILTPTGQLARIGTYDKIRIPGFDPKTNFYAPENLLPISVSPFSGKVVLPGNLSFSGMIRNYFVVTLRNLRKSGSYAFLNMAGLSVGITCTLLILLWVYDEYLFDRFFPKADRLYQVMANVTYDGRINSWGAVAMPAYDLLKTADSRIKNTCAADWGSDHLLTVGDNRVVRRGHYVTEEFLQMFEFKVLAGNPKQALLDPGSIMISASVARALFGDTDPINKIIRVDDKYDQKVTGILADIPGNSSFHFDCLLPWSRYEEMSPWVRKSRTSWDSYSFGVYIELDQPQSQAAVDRIIAGIPDRYGKSDGVKHEFFLYPLTQWRLYSVFENGKATTGGIEYVRMFSTIATFILIIACINFMNLATARSARRAKEVGVRKSIGSGRRELVVRFMTESLLLSAVAFAVSVLLAALALPFYNNLVQKHLAFDYGTPGFWYFAAGLVLFTGLVSGSYPAFYLSAFKPASVLKGRISERKGGNMPRKILVTLQFGFSIVLLIGMWVVYQQVAYVKRRDFGFQKENLVMITPNEDIQKHFRALKDELLRTGVVKSVTKSSSNITSINSWGFLGWPGQPAGQKVLFTNIATEYDYTKTMGIKLLAGRDFSEDFKSDSTSVMINKAALDMMGLKDPIGQQLSLYNGKKIELIGVVENTIMGSPSEVVGPMFIQFDPNWFNAMTLRLEKTDDLTEALKKVEAVVKKFSPAYPFQYSFADVEFQRKFADITLAGKLATLFASLAILITGLGLFGLASYMAEQRAKEIGIRKVLGASVFSLAGLLSKDFSKLVGFAFLAGAPLAWWMLTKFLERYSYHTTIPGWVFPAAGLAAWLFSLVTVSSQAIRAAKADPVRSLRME